MRNCLKHTGRSIRVYRNFGVERTLGLFIVFSIYICNLMFYYKLTNDFYRQFGPVTGELIFNSKAEALPS